MRLRCGRVPPAASERLEPAEPAEPAERAAGVADRAARGRRGAGSAGRVGPQPDQTTGVARINAADMDRALAVLAAVQDLPPDHVDARGDPAGHGADLQAVQAGSAHRPAGGRARRRPGGARGDRDRFAAADRRRDRRDRAGLHRRRVPRRASTAVRGPATSASSEYTLVDAFYHQLCPECAASQPRQAGGPHRPDRTACPAHRRPGQDRYVHRAAAAARRRAHHDHHPIPGRRGPPVRRLPRLGGLAAPATDRRDRPARPLAGGRAGRDRLGRWASRHRHQQRGADRASLAGRLRAAGRRRGRSRCRPGCWRPALEVLTFDRVSQAHPDGAGRLAAGPPRSAPRRRGGRGGVRGAAPRVGELLAGLVPSLARHRGPHRRGRRRPRARRDRR